MSLTRGEPRKLGSFRLLGRLGTGAMGVVYLGSSPAGRPVAVKVIRPEYADDLTFRRRFTAELEAVRTITGGHTPALIDADPAARRPWMATAFVPGPSLAEAISQHGPLPEPAVWGLAAGIAEALAVIHRAGITHRDLKPSNVLLDRDGPKIIDFGISRALDAATLTRTGAWLGTAGYTAPERAAHGHSLPAGDVFALGAILAYAATRRAPFGEGSVADVLYRVVHQPPMSEALAVHDDHLRRLIVACLAKDPADRPTPTHIIEQCAYATRHHGNVTPSAIAARAAARDQQATRLLTRARTLHRVLTVLVPLLLTLTLTMAVVLAGGVPPASSLAPPDQMTGQRMLDILRPLLPSDATISVNNDLAVGTLDIDYDDGKGTVELAINISSAKLPPTPLECPGSLGQDDGPRPDGAPPIGCTLRVPPGGGTETVIITPAQNGGWYQYLITDARPDGTNVSLQVANGPNHSVPFPYRTTPPGTLAQWERIAENPVWHR